MKQDNNNSELFRVLFDLSLLRWRPLQFHGMAKVDRQQMQKCVWTWAVCKQGLLLCWPRARKHSRTTEGIKEIFSRWYLKLVYWPQKIPSKLEVAPHALKMWTGLDGWVDTPYTVTTTRAPCGAKKKEKAHHCSLKQSEVGDSRWHVCPSPPPHIHSHSDLTQSWNIIIIIIITISVIINYD